MMVLQLRSGNRDTFFSLALMIFFPSQNKPQKSTSVIQDYPRFLGLFWKGKTHVTAEFNTADLDVWGHSRGEKHHMVI